MRRFSFRSFILFILLPVLVIGEGVYLLSRTIVVEIVYRTLSERGMKAFTYRGLEMELTGVRVFDLSFTYQIEEQELKGAVEDLFIPYESWPGGNISELPLVLEGGTIELSPAKNTDRSQEENIQLLSTLQLGAELPISTLQGRDINLISEWGTIHFHSFTLAAGKTLTLQAKGKREGVGSFDVQGEITLHSGQFIVNATGENEEGKIFPLTVKGKITEEQRLVIEKDSSLQLPGIESSKILLSPSTLTLSSPVEIFFQPNGISTKPFSLSVGLDAIELGAARLEKSSLTLNDLTATFQDGQWSAEGTALAEAGVLHVGGYTSPSLDWESSLSLKGETLVGTLYGKRTGEILIEGTIKQNFLTQAGEVKVEKPLTRKLSQVHWLSELHSTWSWPLDVVIEGLEGRCVFPWGEAADPTARIELHEGTVRIAGVEAQGVHAEIPLQLENGIASSGDAIIGIQRFLLPLLLSDIKAVGTFSATKAVTLKEVTGKALGGIIGIHPAHLSFDKESWRIPFFVRRAELAELLKLYPQERFSGTGRFDAELPLQSEKDGYSIRDGSITSSTQGGTLQYLERPGEEPPAGLNIALDALRNFHYTNLQAAVTLEKEGKLTVTLSLAGRNPTWQKGRPVDFSVTLEDNIYQLLRSIRLVRSIGERGGEGGFEQ